MKQALTAWGVSACLLAAFGCSPKLVTYPAGEIQPIGLLPQKQVESSEYTASVVSLWSFFDASLKCHQTDMRPIINGLHEATIKEDHDALDTLVPEGMRKIDKCFLLLLDGERALKSFRAVNATARDPQIKKKGERVGIAAEAFLKNVRLWINQGRRILEDGYAYNRSWHEKNLSHLNDKNETSFNNGAKKAHEQERAFRETQDALAIAIRDLLT